MHTTYKYRHMYTSTYVCMCSNDMNVEMILAEGKILMGYWKTKGKQNWVNMVKIHDIYGKTIFIKPSGTQNTCITIINLNF